MSTLISSKSYVNNYNILNIVNKSSAGVPAYDWIDLNSYAIPIETLNSNTKAKFVLILKI